MDHSGKLVYLDTGVLLRRAEALAPPAGDRVNAMKPYIDLLFADTAVELACSEIALIEFHTNLNTHLRSTAAPQWDFGWYETAQQDLFQLIADGRIRVLPIPPRCFELAMTLITEATFTHKRALHSWDAAHVVIAAQWSYDRGQPVEIYSSDSDFAVPLLVSSYLGRLSVTNLDVLAHTRVGLDRTTT